MMDFRQQIKERARAQFANRETHKIEVPEWGATIFYKTPNLATMKQVTSESQGDPFEMQARLVVACATDDTGERIWSKAEYKDLMMAVDPAVVARIANQIMADANLDGGPQKRAEDEKN
jgi:hypothetical protein